jgi:carbon-monoxide dehydrogenase small subunit
MQININVNGKSISADVEADLLLIDFLRKHGCYSVKRGCETGNCGACTVFMDDKPVLSCGVLAARANGHNIVTLEGMQDEALEFADYLAAQGADQCGFCNPGYVMNAMAMFRENPDPTDEEILEYMSGNLCRCSGYESQLRGIKAYLEYKKDKGAVTNGK